MGFKREMRPRTLLQHPHRNVVVLDSPVTKPKLPSDPGFSNPQSLHKYKGSEAPVGSVAALGDAAAMISKWLWTHGIKLEASLLWSKNEPDLRSFRARFGGQKVDRWMIWCGYGYPSFLKILNTFGTLMTKSRSCSLSHNLYSKLFQNSFIWCKI